MSQNPYESPKEANSRPTVKAGVALGGLLVAAIPAGCICGGITCYAVGESVVIPDSMSEHPELTAYIFGIPIGLAVAVLIPVLLVLFSRNRKKSP